jgi:hypothetical protein
MHHKTLFCFFRRIAAFVLAPMVAAHAVELGDATQATRAARPNFAPGDDYSDGRRMFQGIASIERAQNGRLWGAWYGGGIGEDQDNFVMPSHQWRRRTFLVPVKTRD